MSDRRPIASPEARAVQVAQLNTLMVIATAMWGAPLTWEGLARAAGLPSETLASARRVRARPLAPDALEAVRALVHRLADLAEVVSDIPPELCEASRYVSWDRLTDAERAAFIEAEAIGQDMIYGLAGRDTTS